jgi:hypothetical protein
VIGAALAVAACGASQAEHGRRLFVGEQPMKGRIVGHDIDLPTQSSRCVNCHATAAAAAGAGASRVADTQAFGGPLTAERLKSLMPRRGGPPSRFDEEAFCRLLRTGVDPAYIIIPRSMPRYDLPDADCHALWRHVTRRTPAPNGNASD